MWHPLVVTTIDPALAQAVHRLSASMASAEPVPAGGAAAVTAMAMGIALGIKVIRFSTDADGTFAAVAERSDQLLHELLPLFTADCDAYGTVLAAYRLPREPAAERRAAITAAFAAATEVPVQVARIAADAHTVLTPLLGRTNPNLRCDLEAALALIATGGRISIGNARTNAAHLDAAVAARLQAQLADAEARL